MKSSQKLREKHLAQLNFPSAKTRALATNLANALPATDLASKIALLGELLRDPARFIEHQRLAPLAKALLAESGQILDSQEIELGSPLPFRAFGRQHIQQAAFEQMREAMRLPVAKAGALMPDAHVGYGLPIGGVLATSGVVIPYAVGVDIGCRMHLSLFELPANHISRHKQQLARILQDNTRFGLEGEFDKPFDDPVLESALFQELPILKKHHKKAARQIGSSGSGNHFVEFGNVHLVESPHLPGLAAGQYVGLLSHSGSRGLGASIAQHFTSLAAQLVALPKAARHLAWLALDSEEGQMYWQAMRLAGDYAQANHQHIHRRIAKALGIKPLATIENHHNFAWLEQHGGQELVVHRKGATPAGKGTLGIIPGSMSTPAYLVAGKGHPDSLDSASHGAGRLMSRADAKARMAPAVLRQELEQAGVVLLGGGTDEGPHAYKDIRAVMQAQDELVEILGTFQPRIVRMDG